MEKEKIFILWYQGESNAPSLVKACIESIRRNANGHEVIILSDDNLNNWVKFNPVVKEKFESNKFSLQLESDYIRLYILSHNPGLWLDATVYVSQKLPDYIFKESFFTVVRQEAKRSDITNKISPFLLGRGNNLVGKKLFTFAFNLLEQYIIQEDSLINYLLIENILDIGIERDKNLSKLLYKYCNNPQDVLGLEKKLNKSFRKKEINKFLKNNLFNKLNFHKEYNLYANHQEPTVYNMLLNNKLVL